MSDFDYGLLNRHIINTAYKTDNWFDPNNTQAIEDAVEKRRAEGSIKETPDEDLGFFSGVKIGWDTSVISTLNKKEAMGTADPYAFYEPTDEERRELLKRLNYNTSALQTALDGAKTYEDVLNNVDLLENNQHEWRRLQNATFLGTFGGALGSMGGNPADIAMFAIPGGAYAKGARALMALGASKGVGTFGSHLAINVGAAVGANQYKESKTGIESDWMQDVAGVTAMSLMLKGGGILKDTAISVGYNHAKMLAGEAVPTNTVSGFLAKKTLPAAVHINNVREQLMSGLPSVEAKSKLLELRKVTSVPELRTLVERLTNYEQGVRDAGGKQFINATDESRVLTNKGGKELNSGKTTFFEEVNGLRVADRRIMEDTRLDVADLCKGADREVVNEYIMRRLAGEDVKGFENLLDVELAEKVVKRISEGLAERGKLMVDHGIIPKLYKFSKYVPLVIDRYKVAALRANYATEEEFQKAVARNMVEGVRNDARTLEAFRKIYREEMQEMAEKLGRKQKTAPYPNFDEWLDKKAWDSAFGYIDQNASAKGLSSEATGFSEHGVALNFTKHRLPWNTSYRTADGFSINQMRGDIVDVLDRYFKRSTGEIAAKRTFGMGYNDLIKHIDDLIMKDAKNRGRVDTAKEGMGDIIKGFIRRGYGMSISNADYGTADALSEIARNLTYGAYSTLMGVLNYGEISGAIRAYGASFLVRALPGVGEVFRHMSKRELSDADVAIMKNYFVGQDVAKRLRVNEIMRSSRELYKNVPPYLQKMVGISKVLSDYSPGSYVMNYSQQSIIDAVQNTFWSEMIIKAHGGKFAKRGFLRDLDLQRLNLTKDEYQDFMDVLKAHTTIDENGQIALKKGFNRLADAPRFAMTLRRLTNYVSNETIQRRGLDDLFTWQFGNGSPFINLALQFKTFSLNAYNKRFVKLMNRMEDEGVLASLNEFAISGALTAATTLAQLQLRTLGMEEDKRKEFLKKVLGFSSFDDVSPDGLVQALLVTGSRMPQTAPFSLLANAMGLGTKAKTTASNELYSGDDAGDSFLNAPKIGDVMTDMVPVARWLQDTIRGATGVVNVGQDMIMDDFNMRQRRKATYQIQGMFGALPNVPFLTPAIKNTFRDWMEEAYVKPY